MEQLIIKNFGPISSLNINLSQLTLFIGKQSSGKSAIAKLLTIFRDVEFWYNIASGDSIDDLMDYFRDLKISSYFKEDTFFEYRYEDGDVFFITYFKETFSFRIQSDDKGLGKDKESIKAYLRDIIDDGKEELEHTDSILLDNFSRLGLYIPVERSYISSFSASLTILVQHKVPVHKPLFEFASYFDKAKAKFDRYDIPFLNIQYVTQNQNETIILNDEEQMPFDESSSGMQSIIPMLMVTDLCLKEDYFDSYIIEEPELNLFPADQTELFYVLINKVMVAHKKQLAITTHSPHLLAALNNLILAQQLREMNDPELTQAVNDIIPAHLEIDTRQVSIYSLGDKFKEEEYCVNLIDTDTGLIPSEYQEAVLEDVSEKFKELWSLYNENISSEIGQE